MRSTYSDLPTPALNLICISDLYKCWLQEPDYVCFTSHLWLNVFKIWSMCKEIEFPWIHVCICSHTNEKSIPYPFPRYSFSSQMFSLLPLTVFVTQILNHRVYHLETQVSKIFLWIFEMGFFVQWVLWKRLFPLAPTFNQTETISKTSWFIMKSKNNVQQ